ncbi:hypothetical protein ACFV2G_20880, partial [Streptomyces sp. NPDC059701]
MTSPGTRADGEAEDLHVEEALALVREKPGPPPGDRNPATGTHSGHGGYWDDAAHPDHGTRKGDDAHPGHETHPGHEQHPVHRGHPGGDARAGRRAAGPPACNWAPGPGGAPGARRGAGPPGARRGRG